MHAEDEEEDAAPKTVKETRWGWELLNDNKAIWLRNANDVDEEEYDKFFQAVSKVSRVQYTVTYTHVVSHIDAYTGVQATSVRWQRTSVVVVCWAWHHWRFAAMYILTGGLMCLVVCKRCTLPDVNTNASTAL